jgi:starch phosphorylase
MSDMEEFVQVPYLRGAELELPDEVSRLGDLAYNLWWTWTPAARQLFSSVDPAVWARYRNPLQLLLNVDRADWDVLVNSDIFMSSYSALTGSFDAYLEGKGSTWFRRHYPDYDDGPFAYFSMEFGVHQSLAIYSGGLGVLSGDHLKSSSDLGVPLVAVGLLYRFGYFRQTLDADGIQQHHYNEYDFQRLPVRRVLGPGGKELVVHVPFPGREVAARVWVAQVGRVPLLLLDTDLLENDAADRTISRQLYVRGREMRLAQELALGVGGTRALAALGIEPAVYHINEGHSALLQLERLRAIVGEADGDFESALERLSRDVVFTTHTPVPAGNEQFDVELARDYLDVWQEELKVDTDRLLELGHGDHGEANQPFNLTALGLRTCRFANGVSRLNAEVLNEMWQHILGESPRVVDRIEPITNGVHVPTWMGIELRTLLLSSLGRQWLEEPGNTRAWEAVHDVADEEIWVAHRAQKERLGRFTRSRVLDEYARHGRPPSDLRRAQELFDPEVLTIGFARRFATYKRAGLLFSDIHRLRSLLLHPKRPVQILLAGKAHPADRPGQDLIRHIYQLSQEADLLGRVIFLENYDMRVGRMLVQGVDVWLNNPRKPLEASGTSGMKASLNGVLNLSVLDGWWPEAFDGSNGWAIGADESAGEEWQQDQADALSLYQKLEDEVVPTFYDRDDEGVPRGWVRMMKQSIASVGPRFAANRMVRDYVEQAYIPS